MKHIKGIIFDYGGTLDTNGTHWFHIFRKVYNKCLPLITEEQLRDAYVYGERYLATHHIIEPTDDFLTMLHKKVGIQVQRLTDNCYKDSTYKQHLADAVPQIATACDAIVRSNMEETRKILDTLATSYPLVLVSNFYGNIHAVLRGYGIGEYFTEVIESAVVGIRKPDPQIFALGIDALALSPNEVLVVGDSYSKDIIPAHSLGCHTAWLKGEGWNASDELIETPCAHNTIEHLAEVTHIV